jgi:hypothetical protein
MDVGKSITFLWEDDRWLEKLGIGVGVLIISFILMPILVGFLGVFIVLGYSVRLLQNVRNGMDKPLPDWDQWSDDLLRGLKLTVIVFIWGLPMILFVVPASIGGVLADQGDAGAVIGVPLIFCGACLTALYGLFLVVAQPAITIAFAGGGETINSGLRLSAIWQWTSRYIGPVLIVTIVVLAVNFVITLLGSIVGVILCIVGLAVTVPLSILVILLIQHHLYGQLARDNPWVDSHLPSTPASPRQIPDNPIGPQM